MRNACNLQANELPLGGLEVSIALASRHQGDPFEEMNQKSESPEIARNFNY